MKKIIITIITIIISVTITYIIISKNKPYEEFYDIGKDSISSVYKITGLKIHPRIDKSEEGDIKILTFDNVDNVLLHSVKYANYLWKNENFYIISNYNFSKEDGKIEIAKTSVDKDKVFKVSVNCDSTNSFNIVLSLIDGSLIINNRN